MLLRDGSNMCTNTTNEVESMGMPPKETVYARSKLHLQGISDDEFDSMVAEQIKKDYGDHLISQECEGTFKIKDGKVTDISISKIAFTPIFRDK